MAKPHVTVGPGSGDHIDGNVYAAQLRKAADIARSEDVVVRSKPEHACADTDIAVPGDK